GRAGGDRARPIGPGRWPRRRSPSRRPPARLAPGRSGAAPGSSARPRSAGPSRPPFTSRRHATEPHRRGLKIRGGQRRCQEGLGKAAAGWIRRRAASETPPAPAHRSRVTHPPTDGLWALVLAGGDGTRLRELTRLISGAPIPKQYCRILGDRSLLEATLARVAPLVPRERTVVIVNRGHLELAWSQLAALPAQNLLVQPGNRDTGPGVLFSLLALARRQPDATVAVFPSDHHIGDERRFRAHVARMAQLVDEHPEKVALLGVEPD